MTNPVAMLFQAFAGRKTEENSLATVKVGKRRSRPADRIIYPQEASAMDIAFVSTGMQAMFAKDWFSLCTVTEAISLFGVHMTPYTSKHVERLRLLHCVHWNQMPQAVFDSIPEMITEIFLEGPFTPSTDLATIQN